MTNKAKLILTWLGSLSKEDLKQELLHIWGVTVDPKTGCYKVKTKG